MAPGWERGRELRRRATHGVSEWLVSRLAPEPGQTILELAAGTGETGFLAARRLGPGGRLISSDAEPAMLEAAERVSAELGVSNAEFRVLDATAIELPDSSIDGVLCRFGYVLRGDPPAALREARRVLRPGGRFAFAVWAARDRNPWMAVPVDALVGHGHLPQPTGRDRRLSDQRTPEAITQLLSDAGFGEPELEELPLRYVFADADELWFFVSELRVSEAIAKLDEAEQREIRAAIEARAAAPDGGYELTGVALGVLTS
jgi:SAM-dependent methyltransferase